MFELHSNLLSLPNCRGYLSGKKQSHTMNQFINPDSSDFRFDVLGMTGSPIGKKGLKHSDSIFALLELPVDEELQVDWATAWPRYDGRPIKCRINCGALLFVCTCHSCTMYVLQQQSVPDALVLCPLMPFDRLLHAGFSNMIDQASPPCKTNRLPAWSGRQCQPLEPCCSIPRQSTCPAHSHQSVSSLFGHTAAYTTSAV